MNFKKGLLYYLHDLSSQLLTLSQSLGQHGLCELNEKSYQTAHAIPCVSRGRYKRNKSAGILILIKQGSVQALQSGLTVTQGKAQIHISINSNIQPQANSTAFLKSQFKKPTLLLTTCYGSLNPQLEAVWDNSTKLITPSSF